MFNLIYYIRYIIKQMDNLLIILAAVLFIALLTLLLFLFKGFKGNKYVAEDGSVFQSEAGLKKYQNISTKLQALYDFDLSSSINQSGSFEKEFLACIRMNGFTDIKTLYSFRKQLNMLCDIMNE